MRRSGFSIIKWQSSGTFATFRKLFTTGGPIVMLGTKWPSITSTCSIVAPPSTAACTSASSCAKLDERIEGASSIFIGWFPLPLQDWIIRRGQGSPFSLRIDTTVVPRDGTLTLAAFESQFERYHY